MQKVATKLQSFERRQEKRKIEVRQKLNEAKTVAESSLGAALAGFMHRRFEDADANFFIPRTSFLPTSRWRCPIPSRRRRCPGRSEVARFRSR